MKPYGFEPRFVYTMYREALIFVCIRKPQMVTHVIVAVFGTDSRSVYESVRPKYTPDVILYSVCQRRYAILLCVYFL